MMDVVGQSAVGLRRAMRTEKMAQIGSPSEKLDISPENSEKRDLSGATTSSDSLPVAAELELARLSESKQQHAG